MKKILTLSLSLFFAGAILQAQAISINTDASSPDPSAILDVKSTDKGMLVPRMTTAQRTAIAAPATGLLVFDTDNNAFWFYNGTAWEKISPQPVLADTDNDTKIQVEKSPDEDVIRFDLAGTENMTLVKNANGDARLELPNTQANTFVGFTAGFSNAGGIQNTAQGYEALYSNTLGFYNTAVGVGALFSNSIGDSNGALGRYALFSNATGSNNSAVGTEALFANTTGFSNVAIGGFALHENTDRSNLVAVGDSALYNNGLGASAPSHALFNTAVGSKALFTNTTGSFNTASGLWALYSNTAGFQNSGYGVYALVNNKTGNNNTAIGYGALSTNATGNNNSALGIFAGTATDNLANATAVGSNTTTNASNKVRIGNATVTVIEGQVDWTFPSDARFKFNVHDNQVPGLALIEKLRPVTYQFDTRKFDEYVMQNLPDSLRRRRMAAQDYRESSARVQTGFLAQEVEKACQDLNFDFSGLHVPTSASDNYGISYGSFVPLLVKAVQEQQAEIKTQQARIHAQQAEIEQLKRGAAENAALKAQLEKITAALQQAGISLN